MISVMGTGRASGPPDIVQVRLTASAMRPTLAVALADSEEAARRVRAALAQHDVPPADATTLGLSANPEVVWTEGQGSRVTGYRCEHELAVTLRDLTAAGRVLGEVLVAGGDDVRLNGVQFVVEDDTPLRDQAREAAWHDALRRATQLAGLAGRGLGAVVEIGEQAGFLPGPPRPMMARNAASFAPEVAVEPGAVGVEVTLAVQWALA